MTGPQVLTLTVGPMSHGGHCVARHEGRVIFVRHAVPGETVRAVITAGGSSSRFWRADVIDVLDASDHRRRHPWKQADALRAYDHDQLPVGGADYGHITDVHQRRLKSQVFRDTMQRIGGIDINTLDTDHMGPEGELTVEHLPGADAAGMHWRTRASFGVNSGSLAMKPSRSHELIPLRSMPLAVESIGASGIFSWNFAGAQGVDVVAPGGEGPLTLLVRADNPRESKLLTEFEQRLRDFARSSPEVGSIILALADAQPRKGRRRFSQMQPTAVDYRLLLGSRTISEPLPTPVHDRNSVSLPPEGFWQIHRSAPSALVHTVDRMARLAAGGSVIDLYAGAGLFTAWAASRVGPAGRVLSVEASAATSDAAGELFTGVEGVEIVQASAESVATRLVTSDVVVLDPPRAGADKRVLAGIDSAGPGQVIYVSCDPASFARDAKQLYDLGWIIKDLALLDLYPNTHHMESVALFERS
ncbi:class I SAM-dependent RNA methyltransferase [Nesterenkonia haasae]|uniref:class I SAM-dependent RNA methyltransferase n=1 Tax=Nesterenkonia haasae TaxID=2587813 RepID=UPI0013911A70|nr:class I SAM-dependent RNA methyltransferase [Nesterenkonia haasae]NDK30510.1 class I SAM-dependent RNA methyltransferase [Nesterenkonia haasae]